MTQTEDLVTVGRQKIKVTLFLPNKPSINQAVLFLHGWTGKPNNDAAKYLAENGYTALTVIFRGHLGSESSMDVITRKNAIDDAVAAYDYLRSQVGQDTPICVTGSSYGGYTAALLCAERDLNGVSLRVPANYPDEGFDLPQHRQGHENPGVTEWRQKAVHYTETRALLAIHNYHGRVQILEAELDEIVPHQTIQNYVASVNNKDNLDYQLMRGWPHSLGSHIQRNQEYRKVLIKWLQGL